MGKWKREREGERVSLNRRHLEKAHWLWSWLTGPSYLVSHLFRLYAEIKPFSSFNTSFISPSEMTEPTRPATFCRDTGKLIIATCNFLLACSMATTSGYQRDWQQIHVLFWFVFFQSFLSWQIKNTWYHKVQGWRRCAWHVKKNKNKAKPKKKRFSRFFVFVFVLVLWPGYSGLSSLFYSVKCVLSCLVSVSHGLPLSFFLSCDCLPHPD